jgi:hypothetical protein
MDTFNPNQMPPMQGPIEKKSSIGALVAVIIILVLIVVGGLYFLKERVSQPAYVPPPIEEQKDALTESLNQQNASDDLGSIEADLSNTDLDNIDQEASAVEAQLQ